MRGHVLPELTIGSAVGYCDHVTNKFNVGVASDRDARSYTILTENGTHISRNCIDLKCTSLQFALKPDNNVLPKTSHTVSSDANSKHAPPSVPNTNVKCTGKAKLAEKRVEVRKSNLTNSM